MQIWSPLVLILTGSPVGLIGIGGEGTPLADSEQKNGVNNRIITEIQGVGVLHTACLAKPITKSWANYNSTCLGF